MQGCEFELAFVLIAHNNIERYFYRFKDLFPIDHFMLCDEKNINIFIYNKQACAVKGHFIMTYCKPHNNCTTNEEVNSICYKLSG